MSHYTVIFENIISNNIEGLKQELEKIKKDYPEVDINQIHDEWGISLLINAIYNHRIEAVKLLLKYNPELNISSDYGLSPLIVSLNFPPSEHNTLIPKLLLDKGADPNFEGVAGISLGRTHSATPLMKASQRGSLEAVKLLLDYGAEVNLQNVSYNTCAISVAIGHQHIDIVKLLLDNGADISLFNDGGGTPYDIAITEIEECQRKNDTECEEKAQYILKLLNEHINTIKSKQKLSFAKTQDKIHSMVGEDLDPGTFNKISEYLSNMKLNSDVMNKINREREDITEKDYITEHEDITEDKELEKMRKARLKKFDQSKKKGGSKKKQSKKKGGSKKKQSKKGKKISKKYIDKLSIKDKNKQIKSIKKARKSYKKGVYVDRPKLKSFKNKRSSWVVKFENKYGKKITNKTFIHNNIITRKGQELIIDKGKGAYYSSGSRPNQTSSSWAYARLASVILNGKARKYDKKIWDKYKR